MNLIKTFFFILTFYTATAFAAPIINIAERHQTSGVNPVERELKLLNNKVEQINPTIQEELRTSRVELKALLEDFLRQLLGVNGEMDMEKTQQANKKPMPYVESLTGSLNAQNIKDSLSHSHPVRSRVIYLIKKEGKKHTNMQAALAVFGQELSEEDPKRSYSADTLLNNSVNDGGKVVVASEKQNLAQAILKTPPGYFIQVASSLGRPFMKYDVSRLGEKDRKRLESDKLYRRYQVILRGAIAARSVGLSNLFHIASERQTQIGLGSLAGMSKPNASEMEVRDFRANRRIEDPKWFESLQKAGLYDLSRESVALLAEIRKEMHESRKDTERLIAAISMLQIQFADQNARLTLEDIVTNIKNKVEGKSTAVMLTRS